MHSLQLVLQSCLEHGDHQTAAAVAAVLLKAQVCLYPVHDLLPGVPL